MGNSILFLSEWYAKHWHFFPLINLCVLGQLLSSATVLQLIEQILHFATISVSIISVLKIAVS